MRRIGWMLAASVATAACGGGADAAGGDAPPRAEAAPADSAPAPVDVVASGSAAQDTLAFRLHETQPGVVDSIVVTRGGRTVQTLVPGENHVLPETGAERISRLDLDFDGHADLALLAEVGMANSRSHYWRWDARAGRFHPAGSHETLSPDSAAREHTAFNRGGHGGRLWTAYRVRWVEGRLVPVREEAQDWLEDAGRYVRVVRERRGGAMVEVLRDTLDEAELRAAPEWMEP